MKRVISKGTAKSVVNITRSKKDERRKEEAAEVLKGLERELKKLAQADNKEAKDALQKLKDYEDNKLKEKKKLEQEKAEREKQKKEREKADADKKKK